MPRYIYSVLFALTTSRMAWSFPGGAIQISVCARVGDGEVEEDRLTLEVVVFEQADSELLSPLLCQNGVVSSLLLGMRHCPRVPATFFFVFVAMLGRPPPSFRTRQRVDLGDSSRQH